MIHLQQNWKKLDSDYSSNIKKQENREVKKKEEKRKIKKMQS